MYFFEKGFDMLLNIAIDGPAGSGKSTVAKAVAEKLEITYLDTGAMYRMVTLNVINEDITFDKDGNISVLDEEKFSKLIDNISIVFKGQSLFLNNEDVTVTIRNSEVAKHVSKVAAIPSVRKKLVAMQQEIAKGQNIVMDGRDIGTHVLPNANYKFFLVASVEERAKRRMKDFINQKIEISMEELIEDIQNRDYQDSNRVMSPLKQADDAIRVDTTTMSIDDVIGYIIKEIQC